MPPEDCPHQIRKTMPEILVPRIDAQFTECESCALEHPPVVSEKQGLEAIFSLCVTIRRAKKKYVPGISACWLCHRGACVDDHFIADSVGYSSRNLASGAANG